MSVLSLIAKVRASAGSRGLVRDALEALVGPTRAEDGCLAYDLHDSQHDADTFVFVERWRSVPVWERHMGTAHIKSFMVFAESHVAGWELLKLRPAEIGSDELGGRTPDQVFQHHAKALGAENLDELMRDYDARSVLMTPERTYRGVAEIRGFFADLLSRLPSASWDVATSFEGETLFLQWKADSTLHTVSDGVDTFIFEHGMIRLQTARCTFIPAIAKAGP